MRWKFIRAGVSSICCCGIDFDLGQSDGSRLNAIKLCSDPHYHSGFAILREHAAVGDRPHAVSRLIADSPFALRNLFVNASDTWKTISDPAPLSVKRKMVIVEKTASILKSQPGIHLICLIGMPVVMAVINDNWLFTKLGYLDPWYNVGYFLHYDDPAFRADFYKIARASWLIPGFLAYKVFHPLVANFILHVGFLLITTIFIYLTLARLVGKDIAFISAAILTVYFPIHGSGGWDYQTTPSGAYFALTIYFACRAGQLRAQSLNPRYWLVLAGAAFAATFHANIVFINLLPMIVAFYFVLSEKRLTRIEIVKSSLQFGYGFLGLTLLLGIVNLAFGRRLLFFLPLITIVFRYVADTGNEKAWWLPWSSYWWEKEYIAGHLALPAAVLFLASAISLYLLFFRASANFARVKVNALLIGQYVFLGWLWVFWQSVGHVALAPDYFAYPIQLSAFIGLAGIMGLGRCEPAKKDNENRALKARGFESASWWRVFLRASTTSVILVALLALPGASSFGIRVLTKYSTIQRSYLTYLTALAAVTLIVYFSAFTYRRYWPFVLSAATFLFVQVATITAFVSPDKHTELATSTYSVYSSAKDYSAKERCLDRRGSFLALLEVEQAIRKFAPSSMTAYVLWDPTVTLRAKGMCDLNFTELGGSFASISSHPFAHEHYRSEMFSDPTKMPDKTFATFWPQQPLVIFTVDRKYVDGVLDRFKKAGRINMEIRDMRLIMTKRHSFYSYILVESPPLPSQTVLRPDSR